MTTDLIIDFINYISTVKRYSQRTIESYSDVLKEFSSFNNDFNIVDALKGNIIRTYQVHLLETRKLSPRTVNLHLSVLSSLSNYLVKNEVIHSNPVKAIKKPKQKKRLPEFYKKEEMVKYFQSTAAFAEEELLRAFMTQAASVLSSTVSMTIQESSEEGVEYLKHLYESRLNRLIISILYNTGIRRAELISLRINDIDFNRSVLRVLGKGDKMREIPLVSSLSKEISLYLQARTMVVGDDEPHNDRLLISFNGKILYPVYVDRVVKNELTQWANIKGKKSPHILRHSLATELLNDGADLNSIKELLGHSSLAATQVYTHNTIEKIKTIYLTAHPRAKKGGNYGD